MDWNFRNDLPIYSQLLEQIKRAIVSGVYAPGDRLPAVRELAMEAGVNPNTMQRAMQELEREGLVYSQRTAGRFVTEEISLIGNAKKQLAARHIKEFKEAMQSLGFGREEMFSLLEENVKEDDGNAGS